MKTAQTNDGRSITASSNAPSTAICPYCGDRVLLRQRRRMNRGGITFFWRHRSNSNMLCRRRVRPV